MIAIMKTSKNNCRYSKIKEWNESVIAFYFLIHDRANFGEEIKESNAIYTNIISRKPSEE